VENIYTHFTARSLRSLEAQRAQRKAFAQERLGVQFFFEKHLSEATGMGLKLTL
jgi:hypothetical protein